MKNACYTKNNTFLICTSYRLWETGTNPSWLWSTPWTIAGLTQRRTAIHTYTGAYGHFRLSSYSNLRVLVRKPKALTENLFRHVVNIQPLHLKAPVGRQF